MHEKNNMKASEDFLNNIPVDHSSAHNYDDIEKAIEIAYLEGIIEGMGYSAGGLVYDVNSRQLHLFRNNNKGLQSIGERIEEITGVEYTDDI